MDQGVRGAVGRAAAAVRLGRAGRRAAVPGLRRRAEEEYPFANLPTHPPLLQPCTELHETLC